MATRFSGNWACNGIRQMIQAGAPKEEIAQWLASQDKFLNAIQEGIDTDSPTRPGGDGATHAVNMLCEALTEV
jgi:hypothetical protein